MNPLWEGTVLGVHAGVARQGDRLVALVLAEATRVWVPVPDGDRLGDMICAQALRQVCLEALAPFRRAPDAPSPHNTAGEFVWAGHVDGKSVRIRRPAPDALVVEEHLQGRDWAACDDELALHAYEAALLAKAGRP